VAHDPQTRDKAVAAGCCALIWGFVGFYFLLEDGAGLSWKLTAILILVGCAMRFIWVWRNRHNLRYVCQCCGGPINVRSFRLYFHEIDDRYCSRCSGDV
jgi:hypothetical protein